MREANTPPAIRDDIKFTPRTFLKKSPPEEKKLPILRPKEPLILIPEKMPEIKAASLEEKNAGFTKGVSPFTLARLAQRVNSRLASGWTGSRAEKELCAKWNMRPTFAERVK